MYQWIDLNENIKEAGKLPEEAVTGGRGDGVKTKNGREDLFLSTWGGVVSIVFQKTP